jgi:putative nucleotidyltransferase with HDIG domain
MDYSKGGDAHVDDQLARSGRQFPFWQGRGYYLGVSSGERTGSPTFAPMSREIRIRLFVTAVAFASAVCGLVVWQIRLPFPGWWPLATFVFVATLLESLNTQLRLAAKGSTSFIMHMSAALLFGGWWGALVAAISTLLGEIVRDNPPIKVVFNVAQRILAVSLASLAYQALGGQLPPTYLSTQGVLASQVVQRDLGVFFIFATTYFLVNSSAVNTAIVLSSGRAFREVWNLNTRGVLIYDLTASATAVLVGWLYTRFDSWIGFGSLGLIGVIVPIVAIRHVYGLYHKLEDSGQELLQVMVKAIEARDPYTSGHSVRVSELSRAIAVELGLPAREIEQVETAALLHDVGKIHEEFAPLLRKEGRLTDEETAVMQTHSTKSAELVGIISKFRGFIQDSVRHHHERWDGQGYPSGLSGNTIPLASRIILVSDTIDAMTTDRPYRKRLGLEIVVAELQKCKGTQFDPELVDVAVTSVAVRRLIAGASPEATDRDRVPRSRRVSWPGQSLWKIGGA